MTRLLDGAAALREGVGVPTGRPAFLQSRDMVDELRGALHRGRPAVPMDPIALTKVCLDSLALRHGSVIRRSSG